MESHLMARLRYNSYTNTYPPSPPCLEVPYESWFPSASGLREKVIWKCWRQTTKVSSHTISSPGAFASDELKQGHKPWKALRRFIDLTPNITVGAYLSAKLSVKIPTSYITIVGVMMSTRKPEINTDLTSKHQQGQPYQQVKFFVLWKFPLHQKNCSYNVKE